MRKLTVLLLPFIMASCSSPAKKESPVIKSGSVEIAYTNAGQGDTTLLFIHG